MKIRAARGVLSYTAHVLTIAAGPVGLREQRAEAYESALCWPGSKYQVTLH